MSFLSPSLASRPERRLTLIALGLGWLGQLVLGLLLARLVPVPARPLLIDRHRCDPAGWRTLVQHYRGLYLQDQLQRQHFRPVVESSVYGVRLHPLPPSPESLASLAVLGHGERDGTAALRQRYPSALLLTCGAGEGGT